MSDSVSQSLAAIDDAVRQFKPEWVFALFSGGHDSLTASYIASLHPRFNGCVHINTGTGIEATRQFVIDTCAEHDWKMLEYKASENTKADGTPDPQDYEQIVMQHGFPGSGQHLVMYSKLKERQLRRLQREYGRVLFISGARRDESLRRMGKSKPFQIEGNRAWCSAIWDSSSDDCRNLIDRVGLTRNRAADIFGRSGECLCGAFAKKGELEELEKADPVRAAWIRRLEIRVREAGFPWGWEDNGPPAWWLEKNQGQTFMFNYDADHILQETRGITEHLCTTCLHRAA